MLETEGLKYRPDLVVLFLYYNDVWMNGDRLLGGDTFKPRFDLDPNGNLVLRGVPVPKPKPALEDRFKIYALLRDAIKKAPGLYSAAKFGHGTPPVTLPMPAGAGGTADQFRVYQKQDSPELTRVWNITRALLRRMDQETQQHGGKFLVFYAPSRVELSQEEWSQSQIPPTYDPGVVVDKVKQICQSEGHRAPGTVQRFPRGQKTRASQLRLRRPLDARGTSSGREARGGLRTDGLAWPTSFSGEYRGPMRIPTNTSCGSDGEE